MTKKRGKLFIISGPSGAGKSSLISDALKGIEGFIKSVSVTTRPKRKNEKDGEKYRFISNEEFENLKKNEKLLESASYCGFYYGTPKDFVQKQLEAGANVILEIEVQGAMQVKNIIKDAYMIFITVPSIINLKERLSKRNTEDSIEIKKRIKTSEEELKYQKYYDCIIINNNYNEALLNLKNLLNSQKE
jgi:guanylate kinase